MDRRLELDNTFKSIQPTPHVYFQPPESVKMVYPAIRYERTDLDITHADNIPYKVDTAYQVTVIDKNPDSDIVKAVSLISGCRYVRHYTADNLNHDVFIIY